MIESKEDFKRYVAADRARYPFEPKWHHRLHHNEEYYLIKFLYLLRKTEYLLNCELGHGIWAKMKYIYYYNRYMTMRHKYSLNVGLNVCGPGLYIAHLGELRAAVGKIGANCTLRPGMVIAANYGVSNPKKVNLVAGDNVEFSPGCKIFCNSIGDNAVIGPNAVVFHDVPANHKAVGNPAVISPRKRATLNLH